MLSLILLASLIFIIKFSCNFYAFFSLDSFFIFSYSYVVFVSKNIFSFFDRIIVNNANNLFLTIITIIIFVKMEYFII